MSFYEDIAVKNQSPLDGTKGSIGTPTACVLHLTYGHVAGDESVFLNGVGIHFYVELSGYCEQFYDTHNECWGCNGANAKAVQIEFEGDGPLSDAQVETGAKLIRAISEREGIPLAYLDPATTERASVHVNNGDYRGFISHFNVQTDDGSTQHTDAITQDEWDRMNGSANAHAEEKDDDEMLYSTTDQKGHTQWYREAQGYLIPIDDVTAFTVGLSGVRKARLGGPLVAVKWNQDTKTGIAGAVPK